MSDHPSWDEVKGLLAEVLDVPVGTRQAYLDAACRERPALRARVEELLSAHDDAGAFLDEPAFHAADLLDQDPAAALVGRRIGGFTLRSVIAGGGMGIVYEAQQEEPRRIVALKVMRQGIASRSALRRFRYEAQILARLRHPAIAEIYEAGTHVDDTVGGGGSVIPYFAMEYIAGAVSINRFVDQCRLTTEERLRLFVQVADAVHHGHQKGIIHRDLKPANILVDSSGRPKIIDFGVARATDSDLAVTTQQTQIGQLVGTMQYMSPEQCHGDPHDLDIRSDVYALGVVLYEVLTGELPYESPGTTIAQVTEQICTALPRRLSVVNRALRGDIETIAFKALEKDRTKRYQSAADLARDIERFLRREPIIARPASLPYQFSRFVQRHRAVVFAASTIVLVVVVSLIALGIMLAETRAAKQRADNKARETVKAIEVVDETLSAAMPRDQPQPLIVPDGLFTLMAKAANDTLADYPTAQARVKEIAGRGFIELWEYDRARALFTEALALVREGGDDRLLEAQILGSLARLDYKLRDFEKACAAYEAQLRILETEPDQEDDEADVRLKLWTARDYLGDADAERNLLALAESLRTSSSQVGYGRALNALARSRQRHGHYEDALPEFERAWRTVRDTREASRDYRARSAANLASCYLDLGQPDVAVPLFEQAVTFFTEQLGPVHGDTLARRYLLARARYDLGDAPAAAAVCRTALDQIAATPALSRARVRSERLDLLGLFALVRIEDGDLDAARPLVEECRRGRGEPASDVFVDDFYERIVLGRCLLALGDRAGAALYLKQAHDFLVTFRGPEDRYAVMAGHALAEATSAP